jgi:hypothetical protein
MIGNSFRKGTCSHDSACQYEYASFELFSLTYSDDIIKELVDQSLR